MTIKEVYEKWKHIDHLLSDKERLSPYPRGDIIFDLWQAVKEEVEKDKTPRDICGCPAVIVPEFKKIYP